MIEKVHQSERRKRLWQQFASAALTDEFWFQVRAQSRDKQIEERMLAHRQDDNNRHATRHQVGTCPLVVSSDSGFNLIFLLCFSDELLCHLSPPVCFSRVVQCIP